VYFKGINLVNAISDATKFPPVEVMPWIKYIPRWLAPVKAFHGCTIKIAADTILSVDSPLWPYEAGPRSPIRLTYGWVRSSGQTGIWYGMLPREGARASGRAKFITKRYFVRLLTSYILPKLIPDHSTSRFLGATLMDAGAETSTSFLQSFVLALLSYPECQQRIQTEIDAVIGSGRMPNLTDYDELPYLRAFVNEVSVW